MMKLRTSGHEKASSSVAPEIGSSSSTPLTLLASSHENCVHEIFTTRRCNGPNDTSLTHTLESMIATVFNSSSKFINELLQNADDSRASAVQFELFDEKHLRVSHNGEHFSEADVRRICDSASIHAHEKNQNADKIGYKGLGFKSVFCISTKVSIISQEYCFSFDKNYWRDSDNKIARYPWPIIPIPVELETFPTTIVSDRESVHFLLESVDYEKTKQELALMLESLEILLTLRHIKHITFKCGDIFTCVERCNQDDFVLLLQNKNGHLSKQRRWHLSSFNIDLEHEHSLRHKMNSMSDVECPQKMKAAKKAEITFAAEISLEQPYQIIPSSIPHNLYCYLPTEVNTGLPFLVNANFLLSQDRTQLLRNVWNQFLFRKIGELQFQWLAQLAQSAALMPSMLAILPPKEIGGVKEKLKKSYRAGFSQGTRETAFVPSFTSPRLLTLEQTYIDETQFFYEFFGRVVEPVITLPSGESRLISPQLENVARLETLNELPIKKYSFNDLLANIERYLENAKIQEQLIFDILHFLKNKTEFHPELVSKLKKKKILPTHRGAFCFPSECFSLEGDTHLADRFDLNILIPNVHNYPILLTWLRDVLQVMALTRLNIIRGFIYPLIKNGGINRENSRELLDFIYQAFLSDELAQQNFDFLKNFLVVTKNGSMRKIVDCYTPQDNSDIPDDIVIDCRHYNVGDTQIWVQFLIVLGIKTGVNLECVNWLRDSDLYKKFHRLTEKSLLDYYKKCIFKKNRDTLTSHQKTIHSNARFNHFVYFSFIRDMGQNPAYYRLFWSAVQRNWDLLQAEAFFIPGTGDKTPLPIKHYLVYYLRTYRCLRARNNQDLYRAQELYSPTLQEQFEDFPSDILKIADAPKTLTFEQAVFFGFKMELTLDDCLMLLNRSDCTSSPQKLKVLYLVLISRAKNLTREDEQKIERWSRAAHLLASDNTQAPIQTLTVYDVPGAITPKTNQWLAPCELNDHQLIELASILKLQRLSCISDDIQVVEHAFDLSNQEKQILHGMLVSYLPFIICIEASTYKQDIEIIRDKIKKIFNSLKLQYVKKITYTKSETSIWAIFKNGILYYSGRWQSSSDARRTLLKVICTDVFGFSDSIYGFLNDCFSNKPSKKNLENELVETYHIAVNATEMEKLYEAFAEVSDISDSSVLTDTSDLDSILGGGTPKNDVEISSPFVASSTDASSKAGPSRHRRAFFDDSEFSSSFATSSTDTNVRFGPPRHHSTLFDNREFSPPRAASSTNITDRAEPSQSHSPPLSRLLGTCSSDLDEQGLLSSFSEDESTPELPSVDYDSTPMTKKQLPITPPSKGTARKGPYTPPDDKKREGNKLSQQERQAIGRRGEEIVYNKLKQHYKRKYPSAVFEDTIEGFIARDSALHLEVIFNNKNIARDVDSGKNYDIKIIKNGIERFIEVKASASDSDLINISKSEWGLMQEKTHHYRIFRVFNTLTSTPTIEKIKNPWQLFTDRILVPESVQFRIGMKK